ncbi:SAP domain-containing ribonucleoprotein [Astyanax mexicanus]|uniref:SAP domain containing ribonucleoprotein n=1 Tax=Astyanax mexicanus TaxID=7994 RepID=W5KBJ4_ASTMX|nr:SAP domain-containing ribonucleoprotein [Astyanax mexicanus]XP_022538133.1 SAP domain-containing ribonucleoprotein [Astyanax mexicanus]
MAEVVELQKLKLAELKQECSLRGLDIKGNKGDLIARLQQYLEEHEEDVNEEEVLGEFTEEASPKAEEAVQEQETVVEPETEPKKAVVKITAPSSGDERLQKRAERFNLPETLDNKKAARAARFGIPATASAPSKGASAMSKTNVDVEVLKKRAERFGMNVSSVSKKVEEDEKLKKRKERFGIQTGAAAAGAGAEDSEAKKRKRAERFGNV